MSEQKGWIKLHRKITDSWVYENRDMFFYWIDILLMVNHKAKKYPLNKRLITIQPGQKLTSRRKLAVRWKVDKDTVGTILDTFKSDGMIDFENKYNGTLLTVLNYAEYQGFDKHFTDTDSDTDSDTLSDTYSDTIGDTDSDTDSPLTRMNNNVYKNDLRMTKEQKETASPDVLYDGRGFIIEE